MRDGSRNTGMPTQRARCILLLSSCLLLLALSTAQEKSIGTDRPNRPGVTAEERAPSGTPRYSLLNINNLTTWHRSDGHANHSPNADNGLYYPRRTGNVIYQDGLVWGGKAYRHGFDTPDTVRGQRVRVGGGTYGIGTRAGAVAGFGAQAVPENPNNLSVRIFRIRRDFVVMTEAELRRDAADYFEIGEDEVGQTHLDQIRDQYYRDWTEWPVHKGAPYIDRNGNGMYETPPPFNVDPLAGPLFSPESLLDQGWDEPGIAGADHANPADQVLWTVYNDLDEWAASTFVGSLPLGLEVQKTVWGYKRFPQLMDVFFVRYRFINKGGVDTSDAPGHQPGSFWIDSLFVTQWSDPDLGSFSDDLAGSDTTLGMMYSYNARSIDATYRRFGLPPPAIGYDFVAGPAVPSAGDSAIIRMQYRQGLRNLSMRSAQVWGAGDPYTDPPGGPWNYAAGTGRWWKILRGFAPLGTLYTGDIHVAYPTEVPPTLVAHPGDPVTGTGWYDGFGTFFSMPEGDRRMMMGAGPFRMAPGDTQEVHIACVGGLGADRLSSITVMRFNDRIAQRFVDGLFSFPTIRSAPVVRATALDRRLVLRWGEHQEKATVFESMNPGGLMFEGYTIYQLPNGDSPLADGKQIEIFDKQNGRRTVTDVVYDADTRTLQHRVTHAGTDRGVRRYAIIDEDSSGNPIQNGTEYHFAVTAYYVDAEPIATIRMLESPPARLTIAPGRSVHEHIYHEVGDTLVVDHIAGSGTTKVGPVVLDPLAGTGDDYELRFDSSFGVRVWSLSNVTRGTQILSGQTGIDDPEEFRIVEGGILLTMAEPGASPSTAGDRYRYTVAAPARSDEIARENVSRFGVFPNPFSVYNVHNELSVTFTNLPQRAVVRIFNLAGHLVRVLEKDSPSPFLHWDLQNKDGWLVASGIYICYAEFPDLNAHGIVKLGVVTSVIDY